MDNARVRAHEAAAQRELLLEIVDGEQCAHAATALGAIWHAAKWRAVFSSSAGASCRQTSRASLQRLANTHPGMRSLRLGTTPGISASFVPAPASEEPSFGTAASRPWV